MDDWCQPEGDAPRLQYNSFVAVDPRSVSVGQQIDVCAAYTQSIPGVIARRVAPGCVEMPTTGRPQIRRNRTC